MHRTARALLTSGALLLGLAAACVGQGSGKELGAQCVDSKDNDGDGVVDCDDDDCASLPICTVSGDAAPPPDLGPPKEGIPRDTLPPDSPPASSYGQLCTWSGSVTLCPDGKTYCVKPTSSPNGYCTVPCSEIGSCPPAPNASGYAECVFGFNGVDYCAFLCLFQNKPYQCPSSGYDCNAVYTFQHYCWPK